ncbi:unnamed protein product (macronuclear) [Paramecium tetraurelia]|uniref:DUF659 domain-containing protein n=1 Tax=Paramecium tetraurelia TaxID=5888 RepID=A0DBR2_PARTE|nr:uncharacterized protein GSPATT00015376001 [Paramecium tetraurelia]CAK80479.1 unnamed protein product [Paramecium tetraurelia]|eukprot:XP_001447876.1 hypothetical protein (macronuclear) [Paramecium tetraurelia strain d4-2]
MDESGIIGQMILESSGRIKKVIHLINIQSSGTLDNPKLIPFITTIVSSTAKILEKQSLNRVTCKFKIYHSKLLRI